MFPVRTSSFSSERGHTPLRLSTLLSRPLPPIPVISSCTCSARHRPQVSRASLEFRRYWTAYPTSTLMNSASNCRSCSPLSAQGIGATVFVAPYRISKGDDLPSLFAGDHSQATDRCRSSAGAVVNVCSHPRYPKRSKLHH